MKKTLKLLLLATVLGLSAGCEKDDNQVPQNIEVQNFVWKGLNLYYLWQSDVPALSDYRFSDQQDLNAYLYGYQDPGELFQSLLYKPASRFPASQAVDRFSVMYSNYNDLEGVLSGTTRNNGVDLALYYKDDSEYDIIGVVRYILPNSDASGKDIARGDFVYAINGQSLNVDNYIALLSQNTYTAHLANYDGGDFTPNGRLVPLTKTVLSENPVYSIEVVDRGAHKIGYLMYNGFYPNYEPQLNDAFGQLKSQGVTDLVLDLRYNGGGSIATASRLAGMITGQFYGQVFGKEQWNAKVEAYYRENSPGTLVNLFPNRLENNVPINSLNLNRVYVLTTRATASASELVINGLEPYIDVVQIGDRTIGKNVGSITLYDSPSFSKAGANPNHRYAMQPLVLKIINKAGFGDYTGGLQPDELLQEDLGNLGVLGQPTEPLFDAAISHILGGGRPAAHRAKTHRAVQRQQLLGELKNEMYRDVPAGLSNIR